MRRTNDLPVKLVPQTAASSLPLTWVKSGWPAGKSFLCWSTYQTADLAQTNAVKPNLSKCRHYASHSLKL